MFKQKSKVVSIVAVVLALLLTVTSVNNPALNNFTSANIIAQATATDTTIAPGDSLTIVCNTGLHITPKDAHTVVIDCDSVEATATPNMTPSMIPSATATNTPTNTATSTATNVATKTPTNTPVSSTPTSTTGDCVPPYTADSVWNTKITNAVYDANSSNYVGMLAGTFGSDPTQYTMAVYEVTNNTPLKKVNLSGVFSDVQNDSTLVKGAKTVIIPIPDGAKPSAGGDAQFIIVNKDTGDEWGFNGIVPKSDGSYNVKNGYHYNIRWKGVAPAGFGSRGAGVTYLAGLVRPCEIAQGHIDHVIAFAFDTPSSSFVYPATKSDGSGSTEMPEGAHLQLDPNLTDTQIKAWGCTGSCLTIAHALQQYGMIVIDKSGHPKLYAEYEGTAHWNGVVNANTPKTIPYSAFKLLKLN
jgi:hypothetical protein